jgi:hypothetical protein
MAKSACAVPDVSGRVGKRARAARSVRICRNVKNDIVRVPRSARHSADPRSELVEPQRVARSPSDHVIGAGRVAADPEAAHSLAPLCIERKAAAEDIDAADAIADQRIAGRAEAGGVGRWAIAGPFP